MPATPRRQDGGNTLRRIDDTSSAIVYGGQWTTGTVNTTDSNQATVHTSTQSGSTMKFSFTGTFIAVYGVLDGDPYAASFTVDSGSPSAVGLSQPPVSPKPDWPFFSRLLDPGTHELEVTVNSGTFNVDYIEYTSSGSADPSSETSAAAASSSVSASPIPFSKAALSKGAVAGITAAGAVLLVLLVLMIYCVLIRRTRRVRHRSVSPEKPLELIPDAQPKPSLRRPFRLGSIYRPTPARSTRSSKTATSSAPTSVTQSSAMFTSVIMLSPALSMVSEESEGRQQV
ncbi:hypothetical protein K466DRAFT_653101 [Polyporus arcularius HHB13444]|uniref:Uncharacterized protein n=1 Tax=Polyporus arcularius HHB13444 TaxID=1314778 RepID=A0A5C3PFD5_9APHY|nr:hypothetical protein K466DRAFT_653101 [Polyporus arcularius HHB13444]